MKTQAHYIKVPLRCLMALFGFAYLLMVWLGYRYIEESNSLHYKSGYVFQPRISQDNVLQFYVQKCPKIDAPQHSHTGNVSITKEVLHWNSRNCVEKKKLRANIEMEKEWAKISIRYPQYVYTVSGWIQVIQIPNYEVKPLRVFIVPHSHQDPGWKDTFDGYFNSYTRPTLDLLVKHLSKNPTWKFIWPEISYLAKWFNTAEIEIKDKFKNLIQNGQLEIVTGGWVMTDEAVAHYSSMLGQLMEGHLWLDQHLGITPNVSWSVDPFGHSPTMAYLLKKSGIEKMVIQRTHFAIKRHFAEQQSLEFMWRQAWDSEGQTGILCHMMPFLLYAIFYSCGPDPHVCCQFDFSADKCFRGTKTVPKVTVNSANIRKLSWALWEQFQKKSQLYRSNLLLVPHGDDFRYSSEEEWTQQFGNLAKLMEYMNKERDMNIKVEFGTLSDYFNALEQERKTSKLTFPSLTGDFFPYNDRDDQYWTGYYSVRPLIKRMVRIVQAQLRITEMLFLLSLARSSPGLRQDYMQKSGSLVEARQTLAVLQHHDAITGTSKNFVMSDYARLLQAAMGQLHSLWFLLVFNNLIMPNRLVQPRSVIEMTEDWKSVTGPPELTVGHLNLTRFVTVTNPLTVHWTSVVTVRTSSPCLVRIPGGSFVASQINPVITSGSWEQSQELFDILFVVELPALTLKVYELVKDAHLVSFSSVTIFGNNLSSSLFPSEFNPTLSNKSDIQIENHWLKASFSPCSGTLQHTLQKSDNSAYRTKVQMMTYGTGSWINPFKDKSGAYIFMPDGPAKEMEVFYPTVVVIKGAVMSSVVSFLPGVLHTTTLYNVSGPIGAGVHIDNVVDISTSVWANKELAMRISTDIISPDRSICVDLNGYQMQRKLYRSKFLIQGNFHPMTSMAYITDGKLSRLTLITAETHGVASLSEGTMEVILDRKLMQDDWRGLNEGPHDNVASPSKFILLLERRNSPNLTRQPCRPSLLSHLLSNHLNNLPQLTFMANLNRNFNFEVRFMTAPWPCPYILSNVRHLDTDPSVVQGLVSIHKAGLDCSHTELYMQCDSWSAPFLSSFGNVHIQSVTETSLTGIKDIATVEVLGIILADMEIKTFRVVFR